ncbi:MAG: substrate-binding domain-containing protein [Bacteroidetes bacterium]|nr:substrate-binding domain-containing protein [Bacteroidota bacterium]
MATPKKKLIECCISLSHSGLSEDLFFIQVLDGIVKTCENTGYHLVLNTLSANSPTSLRDDFTGISGVILINPLSDHSLIDKLNASKIPFVVIGTPEIQEDVFSVDIDVVGAAYQVSHYLIAKGHSNICYINSPGDYMHSNQYKRGFKLAHHESQVPWFEKNYSEQHVTSEAGYQETEKILHTFPECTAIVTTNETVAKGVLDKLHEARIRIPKKMAVMSMGGTPVGYLYKPGITTIDYSSITLGTVAADLLVEVISKKRIRPSHLLLPTQLIERETT